MEPTEVEARVVWASTVGIVEEVFGVTVVAVVDAGQYVVKTVVAPLDPVVVILVTPVVIA